MSSSYFLSKNTLRMYIFGIIQSATVISTLICLYKVRERERERERILKICGINNSLHPQWSRNYNKLNDINYRVKWAMGNWYNKAQIITLPNLVERIAECSAQ